MANEPVKLTYEDLVRFPDDGKRHELIDGEHYVTPASNRKHQDILGNLHFLIRLWLESHAIGRVYRRRGERFDRAEELSLEAEGVLTTGILPGLELPLSRIFAS